MRIYTRIVIDMETLQVLERDGFDYNAPIMLLKGDSTASGEEKSQAGFSQQLQNAFQTNNAAQQNQLSFLNTKMQDAINNPQGYNAQTLASMRAGANDRVAAENQNVQRSVQAKQMTQGGADALPSGVNSQISAAVASQAAQAGNQAQQNITEQNESLKNQNMWKAVQTEDAVAGQENPEGMAGEENGAANSVTGLSGAVTQSSGPTFGSILGGVVGAGLGAAGSYFGGKKG